MNRSERIFDFIANSRAELQLSVLAEKILYTAAQQWVRRLAPIPDDHLEECYDAAMNARTTRSALTPHEILAQWNAIAHTVKSKIQQPHHDKTCPQFCSWDGWIVVNAADVMQMDARTAEYTYAKPCPIHRPQGYTPPKGTEFAPRISSPVTSDQPVHPVRSAPTSEGWKSAGAVAQQAIEFPETPDEDYEPSGEETGWEN